MIFHPNFSLKDESKTDKMKAFPACDLHNDCSNRCDKGEGSKKYGISVGGYHIFVFCSVAFEMHRKQKNPIYLW